MYIVKPAFWQMWNIKNRIEAVVSSDDIVRMSYIIDCPYEDLMEQVEEY